MFSHSSSLIVWLFWANLVQLLLINYLPFVWHCCRTTTRTTKAPRHRHVLVRRVLGANAVALCLYASLLHRPHNVALTGALLMCCDRVHEACGRLFAACGSAVAAQRCRWAVQTVATVWLGRAFFYYQGNSNSLASVDLTTAFVGLGGGGSWLFAGVQVAIGTYAAVLVSAAVLLWRVVEQSDQQASQGGLVGSVLGDVMALWGAMSAVPLVVFLWVTTHFQSHIFVWSVFSPKLLYALCGTVGWVAQLSGVWLLNQVLGAV